MKPRKRRVGVVLALLLLATVAGLWLARDVPRQRVEQTLSESFGGEVRVGRLVILSRRQVALEQVTVRAPTALPWLERLHILRVEATGSLAAMADGRFEVLRVLDADARLTPPPAGARTPPAPSSTLSAELLTVERARVRYSDADPVVQVAALVRGLGSGSSGAIQLASDRLALAPLLAVAGFDSPFEATADQFKATVRLIDSTTATVVATADALVVSRPGRAQSLEDPRIDGTIQLREDGGLELELLPFLPGLGSSRVEAVVSGRPWRLGHLAVRVRGARLAPWLDLLDVAPRGWSADGTADAQLRGSPADGLELSARILVPRLQGPFGSIASEVSIAGHLDNETGSWQGSLEANANIGKPAGSDAAPIPILENVLPAAAAVVAEVAVGGRSTVRGRLQLTTAAAGSLEADGSVDSDTARVAWQWHGCDLACLLSLGSAITPSLEHGLRLDGGLAATGTVAGPWASPRVQALLELEDVEAAPVAANGPTDGAWSLRAAAPQLAVIWRPAARKVDIELPTTTASLSVPGLGSIDVRAAGAAAADTGAGRIELRSLAADCGGLGRARATAAWGRAQRPSAHLLIDGAEPGAWIDLLRPTLGDRLPGYDASGQGSFELELAGDLDGAWSATGEALLEGGGFLSDDGARAAEGIEGRWQVRAEGREDGAIVAAATGTAGDFQLLWGTVFADWSDLGVEMDLDIDLEPPPARSWTARVELGIPDVLRLGGSTRRAPGRPTQWTVALDLADLGAAYERYIERPLQGSAPALDGLDLRGRGSVSLESTISGRSHAVSGRVQLRQIGVETSGGLRVSDLNLDLPVNLEWHHAPGHTPTVSGSALQGSLSIAGLTARGLELAAAATALVVEGDTVSVQEDLSIPVAGGTVELEDLALNEALRSGRHVAATITLRGLDLQQVTRALGLPPLDGELDGTFPTVRLGRDALRVDGAGELSLFGGTVMVSDISGHEPLGRYPRWRFSAQLREIDLGRLTRTFDVGEITGTLEGEVTDCELFAGSPLRCHGRVNTVRRDGVPQRISLKAINNIAIVGTGSGMGLFGRGLHSLLRTYSYDSFGLEMHLDHDHFLLRGLEHRGDRELILKGKLPFRIDVVNAEPGTTVSFRTMLERLGNLDFGSPTTQP